MILPTSYVAAGSATTDSAANIPTPNPSSGNWSSIIGIVTAIVGNILISFALNLQRYAHIRLNREWEEEARGQKKRSTSYEGRSSAEDGHVKDRPARRYRSARQPDFTRNGTDDDYDATESDPLIPSSPPTHGLSLSRSRTSGRSVDASSNSGSDGPAEKTFKQKSYLKSLYWWAGIILMVTGEAGNFLAYGFAPASIVSPLGVVALISNCIIAPFLLKERFRVRDGLGVVVAVGGAVTVVLSASNNNPKLGPEDIWGLITTWEFETYLGITIVVIVALMFASNRFGDKNILIDLGLVGLFGGYTALSTKGVASMLSYTLWRAITFPVTYLLVAILAFTAVMQIKYINRALQRFDATQVIPTQFVLFTLSVILGSAILYRDFERTPSDDAGKFVGGCFLTFLGVWLITSGRRRPVDENEEGDDEPGPPEAIRLVDEEHCQSDRTVGHDKATSRGTSHRDFSPPIAIRSQRPESLQSGQSTPVITVTPHETSTTEPTPSSLPKGSPLEINPWEQERSGSLGLLSGSSSPSYHTALGHPVSLSREPTQSTPVLPSELATTPTASSTNAPHFPATIPQTPRRGVSDNNVATTRTPSPGPKLRRGGTAERLGGRTPIAQGPLLASPLSTSLAAVVADLKRGGGVRGPFGSLSQPQGEPFPNWRRESVLGIGGAEGGRVGESEGDRLSRTRSAMAQGDVESGERRQEQRGGLRGRSLSGTLGELFKGWRRGAGDEAGDVERR